MGLFSKKEMCSVCSKNEGKKKLMDGCICKECIEKTAPFIDIFAFKDTTTDKAKQAIAASDKNKQLLELFQPTKKIEKYISFDENNQLWKANYLGVIFSYEEIVDFELLEDGETITKGGLGRAVVGGALFGGVGSIVGATTGKKKSKVEIRELKIKITTKHPFVPVVYIQLLITGSVKAGSILYNSYKGSGEQILSELTVITDALNQSKVQPQTATSDADEILKFKKLYDEGIITAEEFEMKKKQLLGL